MNWQERLEAARAQQVPGPGCRSGAKAGTSGVRIGCRVSAWTPCSAQAFGCLSRAGVTSRLPERFLQAPCPRDHGEGSGTPLLWETLPRFQNESAVGRRRQLQGVPLRPAGTSARSGSIHPLWVGRLRQAPSPADLPQAPPEASPGPSRGAGELMPATEAGGLCLSVARGERRRLGPGDPGPRGRGLERWAVVASARRLRPLALVQGRLGF